MDERPDMSGLPVPAGKTDVEKLHEMGYAQELKRGMGAFSNFAVSFTIISILAGCLTLFGFGMYTGGPASSAYGWPIVGILVTFVALAMAEVCSSYPTAGGLYYWSAKVDQGTVPRGRGSPAGSTCSDRSPSRRASTSASRRSISAFMHIAFNVEVTRLILVLTYTTVLAIHGLMNTFGISWSRCSTT